MKKIFALLLILACGCVWAQEFGFGFDDETAAPASSKPASPVKIGGDITVEVSPYVRDFKKKEGTQEISFWDMISGTLNFTAGDSNIEAYAKFNLNYDAIDEIREKSQNLKDPTYTPLILDEVYLKAFIGQVNIEAGLRKLAWGKADSPGPLDITNPMDYSDLRNITDVKSIKIARPMIHITWNAGTFSKLEGVFIPNFAGHRYDLEGRWQPSQAKDMPSTIVSGISSMAMKKFAPLLVSNPSLIPLFTGVQNNLLSSVDIDRFNLNYSSSGTLENYQAGLRFTTTIGSADIGTQYFYGHLFRPNFTLTGVDVFLDDLASGIIGDYPPLTVNPLYTGNPDLISPIIKYNRYHQIGIDYAQVLFGFNIRAEAAIHITEDLSGDDGAVQNPFIGWSLGFDRSLLWGITLNIQCNETIRLLNDKIGDNPILDAEADTKAISTRLTMRISKSFFMDKLESSATVIWDVENSDFYIIPSLVWTEGNMSWVLAGGIFAGKETGDLGQYWRNNYVKFGVTYSF
jgi:hypothetical protein